MAGIGYTALMDNKSVKLVFAEVGVIKGKAEINTEFKVEGEEDLSSFAVGVLKDWKSEDYEIGKAKRFVCW